MCYESKAVTYGLQSECAMKAKLLLTDYSECAIKAELLLTDYNVNVL